MLKPLPVLSTLFLAACQSAPLDSEAFESWREGFEHRQAELQREVQGVRDLIAARSITPMAGAAGGLGGTLESNGALEAASRIVGLEDQLHQIQAAVAALDTGAAVPAGHSVVKDLESTSLRAGAINALKEGLIALEKSHALHCENIANVDVPGFKRRDHMLTSEFDEATGLCIPASRGIRLSMLPGVLELTGNELDFAVEGDGFFKVALPNGTLRYTRNGSFRQDFTGRIVTPQGWRLMDQVTIPPGSQGISISGDGQAFSLMGGTDLRAIGTIHLHTFSNPSELVSAGGGTFTPTAESGAAQARIPGSQGTGELRQGYLERANVELTRELIDLQSIERQAAAIRRALASHGIYAH